MFVYQRWYSVYSCFNWRQLYKFHVAVGWGRASEVCGGEGGLEWTRRSTFREAVRPRRRPPGRRPSVPLHCLPSRRLLQLPATERPSAGSHATSLDPHAKLTVTYQIEGAFTTFKLRILFTSPFIWSELVRQPFVVKIFLFCLFDSFFFSLLILSCEQPCLLFATWLRESFCDSWFDG